MKKPDWSKIDDELGVEFETDEQVQAKKLASKVRGIEIGLSILIILWIVLNHLRS